MKSAFSFRSYLLVLLNVGSIPCVRHRTAVPWEAGSAQQGRPRREKRCLFPASTCGEQHHNPGGFWHSPTVYPWWPRFGLAGTRGKHTDWCLNLSITQEALGRKRWRFPMFLSFLVSLSCSVPQGTEYLLLDTNNSPSHQSLFLRFKMVEMCVFLCVCI